MVCVIGSLRPQGGKEGNRCPKSALLGENHSLSFSPIVGWEALLPSTLSRNPSNKLLRHGSLPTPETQ